jgi:hypothetical protein
MTRLALLVLLGGSLAGCLRTTQFMCSTNDDCASGGTCEAVGYCSFPDTTCTTGSRFGGFSGQYANQCVDVASPDAGVDAPPDAGIDAKVCPAAYAPLAGAPHVYRAITNAHNWDQQKSNCAGDGGYLAIPDDLGELTAILTLNGANEIWVGLTDSVTEGTFLTVLGAPAVFLPWDTGEPNNTNNSDCARAKPDLKLADDRCSVAYRAVCECE